MQRDDTVENQLKSTVQEYVTEILILLACAVKTADYSRPLDVRESIPEETKTLYIDTS